MRLHKREFERLEKARSLVASRFPGFGVNKAQEAVRLIYEISKRDDVSPQKLATQIKGDQYEAVKKILIEKRYPAATLVSRTISPYLPKIDLSSGYCADLKPKRFSPLHVYIEKAVTSSHLAKRMKQLFPGAVYSEIESLKAYIHEHGGAGLEDYNKRKETLFIVKENYDHFKRCPCTQGALGCGYEILNLGSGCIFDCTYCFLQGYVNSPGLVLPANIEKFFDNFNGSGKKIMRIGTGEFTDSLALDNITEYSIPLVDFFKDKKEVLFEFKTKSTEVANVLDRGGSRNIAISWSVNPQIIIEENEFFTAPLKARIEAASACVAAGYRVGFHFDPVIYFDGWEKAYASVIEGIFAKIKPCDIAWISIGTFRFSQSLKPAIEKRFPANKILDEELLPGYDSKLRYSYALRYRIYRRMIDMLASHSRRLAIYLCMEEAKMWKDLEISMPFFQ